ncbi:sigma-70 family RNA polymerase sigma factor [Atopobacter phocae]|uniref:sigma-70 family RNA polymerase sigma factor n=1 Tax=Atopobacter phocae TaxID=136492 RepID=UPI00046F82ED|nr:sigma-70 family RNA polymerase sigma factor [Atopobacter phocae]
MLKKESLDELLLRYQAGEEELFEEFFKRFSAMMYRYSYLYPIAELERDDFIQEASTVLYRAMGKYNVENGTGFTAYYRTCLKNEINSILRRALAKKRASSRDNVMYEEFETERIANKYYEQTSGGPSPYIHPEAHVLLEESVDYFIHSLSDFEQKSFYWYTKGYTIDEIAERVCRPVESVQNALKRCRRKMREALYHY